MSLEGLPHSGIFGSKPVCGSPKLFAAYHALHRLLAPRHSPYALSSLTIRTLDADARRLRAPGSGLQPSLAAAPKPDVRNPRASAPRMHTACVWSENYRCKVFSCQRAQKRSSASVSKSLWLAGHRRPAFAPIFGASARPTLRGLPTVAHARVGTRERRLENTGLEPVTSWLQTRRSPS
jgi:hypothetical protein